MFHKGSSLPKCLLGKSLPQVPPSYGHPAIPTPPCILVSVLFPGMAKGAANPSRVGWVLSLVPHLCLRNRWEVFGADHPQLCPRFYVQAFPRSLERCHPLQPKGNKQQFWEEGGCLNAHLHMDPSCLSPTGEDREGQGLGFQTVSAPSAQRGEGKEDFGAGITPT